MARGVLSRHTFASAQFGTDDGSPLTLGELLATLVELQEAGYVVLSCDGRYDGGRLVASQLSIANTHDIYPGPKGHTDPAEPCVLMEA